MPLAAMRLATSPDWCPPMPSATTYTLNSGKRMYRSSLWLRSLPTSERPAAIARMFAEDPSRTLDLSEHAYFDRGPQSRWGAPSPRVEQRFGLFPDALGVG